MNGAPADTRGPSGVRAQATIKRIDRLAYWLDNSIKLPGINYRIGYDALIGLVPGVGDAVALGLSAFIVWEAARVGAGRTALVRMIGNVALEMLVGAVPVLGDLFDATYKANARNINILYEHLGVDAARRQPVSQTRLVLLIAGVLVLALVVCVFLVWGLVEFVAWVA